MVFANDKEITGKLIKDELNVIIGVLGQIQKVLGRMDEVFDAYGKKIEQLEKRVADLELEKEKERDLR